MRSRLRLGYGGRWSRSRLGYAVDFGVKYGVKYGVKRSRKRLEFSVEKLKFEA